MKGVFIPEITVEMLKSASLEAIEDFFSAILDGEATIFDAELPTWIPCSERLPEDYDWYLVSDKETSWVALWKDGVFLSVSGYLEFSDIIAWMPLPEPYVERRTDD